MGAFDKALVNIRETPRSAPSKKKVADSALSEECSRPLTDANGRIEAVLYGGRILNNDLAFIDRIVDIVFENRIYDKKPVGTVTIFLDDVRVATNVTDARGGRAIGTRMSKEVYDEVVGKGGAWLKRAFVVTDWYLTAYKPIRNINGKVIGTLYVGILEKTYSEMVRHFSLIFLMIILCSSGLALSLSYFLIAQVTGSVDNIIDGIARMSSGRLDKPIDALSSIEEFGKMADALNKMSGNLKDRMEKEKEFILIEARIHAEEQKTDELRDLNKQLMVSAQELKTSNERLLKIKGELQERMESLEKMNELMVGRELRVIELKGEINKLCRELGRSDRYSGGGS
jgi:two-component system NtrC family sensor kinase